MKVRDAVSVAEEAARELAEERNSIFEPSRPENFPRPPEDRSEALRLKLRKRADEDLYFFTKFVLGYSLLRPDPHGELCAFLDYCDLAIDEGRFEDANRTITYMPRDTFKTTIATIARNIRRACKNPELRILITADTSDNASRFMIEIGNHFRFNEMLQWLYPEVIPESFSAVRWNTKELVLKRKKPWREPTFDAMGAGAGIESRHYDHIAADDLVTEKHIHSDTEMDKLIAWFPGLESLLVNDVESTIDFVGSRKKPGDAYEAIERYFGGEDRTPIDMGPHCERRGEVLVYFRSIWADNGKDLIFPYNAEKKSGISKEFIERIRTYDPDRYWAQYANSPKGSGLTTFKLSDIRKFTIDENGLITAFHDGKIVEEVSVWALERIFLYDPAVSERKVNCKNALWIVAKGSGPNRYLLGGHYGHILPDEMIRLLYEENARWRPEFISIEKRGFQGWVKYSLDLISELQGLDYLPVVSFPPDGSQRAMWSKPEHIRSLQPITANHLLWLPASPDERYAPAINMLLNDIEFYPTVKFDDGLDALAQGVEWWPFTIDDAERAAGLEREGRFLQATLPDRMRSFLPSTEGTKIFNEEAFLAQLDATGYGFLRVRN